MQAVGLVLNVERKEARTVGQALLRKAKSLGIQLKLEALSAEFLGVQGLPLNRLVHEIDGLIAAGGDGTLLSTVAFAASAQRPILGINVGSLGFLTSLPASHAAAALESFVSNQWTRDERTMLDVAIHRDSGAIRRVGVALNDAHLGRGRSSLLVHFSVWVDDELVTHYAADGFLVATPTGSTAYSLAANGAILTPRAPVLSLTPICPHTLTNRPVIISDESVIRMRSTRPETLWISLDGHRGAAVPPQSEVRIRLSDQKLCLARIGSSEFFGVLRTKLRWSGSNIA